MIWRNDYGRTGYPTSGSVVICADNIIYDTEKYLLSVLHVRTIHGERFMPSLKKPYGISQNGGLHEKFVDALLEGAQILKKYYDREA